MSRVGSSHTKSNIKRHSLFLLPLRATNYELNSTHFSILKTDVLFLLFSRRNCVGLAEPIRSLQSVRDDIFLFLAYVGRDMEATAIFDPEIAREKMKTKS